MLKRPVSRIAGLIAMISIVIAGSFESATLGAMSLIVANDGPFNPDMGTTRRSSPSSVGIRRSSGNHSTDRSLAHNGSMAPSPSTDGERSESR